MSPTNLITLYVIGIQKKTHQDVASVGGGFVKDFHPIFERGEHWSISYEIGEMHYTHDDEAHNLECRQGIQAYKKDDNHNPSNHEEHHVKGRGFYIYFALADEDLEAINNPSILLERVKMFVDLIPTCQRQRKYSYCVNHCNNGAD